MPRTGVTVCVGSPAKTTDTYRSASPLLNFFISFLSYLYCRIVVKSSQERGEEIIVVKSAQDEGEESTSVEV